MPMLGFTPISLCEYLALVSNNSKGMFAVPTELLHRASGLLFDTPSLLWG